MVAGADGSRDFWGSAKGGPPKKPLLPRPNRNVRLREYARLGKEIESLISLDPPKAAELFHRTSGLFFAEGWTVNHFPSSEFKALLLDTNEFFKRFGERLGLQNSESVAPRSNRGAERAFCRKQDRRSGQNYRSRAKASRKKIEIVLVILAILTSAVLMFIFA